VFSRPFGSPRVLANGAVVENAVFASPGHGRYALCFRPNSYGGLWVAHVSDGKATKEIKREVSCNTIPPFAHHPDGARFLIGAFREVFEVAAAKRQARSIVKLDEGEFVQGVAYFGPFVAVRTIRALKLFDAGRQNVLTVEVDGTEGIGGLLCNRVLWVANGFLESFFLGCQGEDVRIIGAVDGFSIGEVWEDGGRQLCRGAIGLGHGFPHCFFEIQNLEEALQAAFTKKKAPRLEKLDVASTQKAALFGDRLRV
jgi:hypothetical protein